MGYFVYILHSPRYNKYYIGQTADLSKTVVDHNSQINNNFTAKYRPWILATYLKVDSRKIAMAIEKYLKKKNRAFIIRVINEEELREYIIMRFSSLG